MEREREQELFTIEQKKWTDEDVKKIQAWEIALMPIVSDFALQVQESGKNERVQSILEPYYNKITQKLWSMIDEWCEGNEGRLKTKKDNLDDLSKLVMLIPISDDETIRDLLFEGSDYHHETIERILLDVGRNKPRSKYLMAYFSYLLKDMALPKNIINLIYFCISAVTNLTNIACYIGEEGYLNSEYIKRTREILKDKTGDNSINRGEQ
jgi:hypothetical protein